jgi:hypothetical protein
MDSPVCEVTNSIAPARSLGIIQDYRSGDKSQSIQRNRLEFTTPDKWSANPPPENAATGPVRMCAPDNATMAVDQER